MSERPLSTPSSSLVAEPFLHCQECGRERGWNGPCPTCGADLPRLRFDLWPITGRFETEPKQ